VDGTFQFQRVELEPAMNALKADIPSDGMLEAKGRYSLQSVALERLFDAPRLDGVFTVRKGDLSGLDLVRALQSPSRDGTAGGKTKFEEMSATSAPRVGVSSSTAACVGRRAQRIRPGRGEREQGSQRPHLHRAALQREHYSRQLPCAGQPEGDGAAALMRN
jgi:hypothetical protein